MIYIPESLLDAVNSGTPAFICGKVTMEDGVFSGIMEPGCFSATGCSIQSGTTGSNFPVGEAICRVAQLELMGAAELGIDPTNPYSYEESVVSDHEWLGARLELYLCIPDETESSGYGELTQIGFFNVAKAEYTDDILTLTAYDDMSLFDIPSIYSTDADFSWSYGEVFRDICKKCGVGYEEVSGSGQGSHNGKVVKNAPEGYFRNEPDYKDLTCRQILGYIAMISGGNVIINGNGKAEIVKYDTSLNAQYHDVAKWMSYRASDKDYTVTGIKYVQKSNAGNGKTEDKVIMAGSAGYLLDVTSNPLICRTYNIRPSDNGFPHELNQIYNALKGVTFCSFDCETIPGPSMEFMDCVKITDRAGNKRKSYISSLTYNVLGSTMIQNNTNTDAPATGGGGSIGGSTSGGGSSSGGITGGSTSIMIDDKLLTPNASGVVTIPNATANNAGVMTAADKTKLDSILDGNVTGVWTPEVYRHYNQTTSKVNSGVEAIGIYTKTGNIVTLSFSVKWLSTSTQNEGLYFTIAGIPYAPNKIWSGGGTLEGYYATSTNPNAVFTGWRLDTDSHVYPVCVYLSGSAGDVTSGYCRPGSGDMIMSGTITYTTA